MPDDATISWEDLDLKLGILQILIAARRANARSGGATVAEISGILVNSDREEIKLALYWMRGQKFVVYESGQYLITVLGVDFVCEEVPIPDRLRQDVQRKSSSGWWQPPPDDPTDSSGVPRKPRPTVGAGEIALPLPAPPADG